jgi:hypothetical protein
VRRLINVMMFLLFVNESDETGTLYSEVTGKLFGWVDAVLFAPYIKLRPFDIIMVVLCFTGVKGARTKPMRSALIMAIVTTVLFFILGIARGGDSRAASWQVYLMIFAPVAAFGIAAHNTKAAHYRVLARVVVYAALYRAVRVILFYFTAARAMETFPPMMSTHSDTVLWVTAVGILIVHYLELPKGKGKGKIMVALPLILAAIHFNNRRLAWVSVAFSLLCLFLLMPKSATKRKLNRMAVMMVPVLGLYVAVGWGRPEKIFKPLASLSSVSSKPDGSTLARNVENLSLIATANYSSALTGTGWGHKYVELSNKYTIEKAMELWPYIPHNSILGLLGFTGFLGVMGYWLMFPTGVFMHARVARLAKDPLMRSTGLVGVMATITSLNQMFGDMGIFSWIAMYMLSMVWAAAMRLPFEAGVWPGGPVPAGVPVEPPPPPMASQPVPRTQE